MKGQLLYIIGCLVVIIILTASKIETQYQFSEEEIAQIHEEVEKNILLFIQKKEKECQKALMEKVENKVDTILMFQAHELMSDLDSSSVWNKPERPERPDLLNPIDTSPLAPLVQPDVKID